MAENKKYGYIRVSSKGQAKDGNSLEAQERAVKDAGAQSVYTDVFTGTKTKQHKNNHSCYYKSIFLFQSIHSQLLEIYLEDRSTVHRYYKQ